MGPAVVDYAKGTIRPCTPRNVALGIGRVTRYGTRFSRTQALPVLGHSVLVARIATWLLDVGAGREMDPKGFKDVVACYAALHDAEEIFGGDVPSLVPAAVRRALQAYQQVCGRQIRSDLGFPEPSKRIAALVHAADLLAVPMELRIQGESADLQDLVDHVQATTHWLDSIQGVLRAAGLGSVNEDLARKLVRGAWDVCGGSGLSGARDAERAWRRILSAAKDSVLLSGWAKADVYGPQLLEVVDVPGSRRGLRSDPRGFLDSLRRTEGTLATCLHDLSPLARNRPGLVFVLDGEA